MVRKSTLELWNFNHTHSEQTVVLEEKKDFNYTLNQEILIFIFETVVITPNRNVNMGKLYEFVRKHFLIDEVFINNFFDNYFEFYCSIKKFNYNDNLFFLKLGNNIICLFKVDNLSIDAESKDIIHIKKTTNTQKAGVSNNSYGEMSKSTNFELNNEFNYNTTYSDHYIGNKNNGGGNFNTGITNFTNNLKNEILFNNNNIIKNSNNTFIDNYHKNLNYSIHFNHNPNINTASNIFDNFDNNSSFQTVNCNISNLNKFKNPNIDNLSNAFGNINFNPSVPLQTPITEHWSNQDINTANMENPHQYMQNSLKINRKKILDYCVKLTLESAKGNFSLFKNLVELINFEFQLRVREFDIYNLIFENFHLIPEYDFVLKNDSFSLIPKETLNQTDINVSGFVERKCELRKVQNYWFMDYHSLPENVIFNANDLSVLDRIFQFIEPSSEEFSQKVDILNRISARLNKLDGFSELTGKIFGSSVSNLGFKRCDIDILLFFKNTPKPFMTKYNLSEDLEVNRKMETFLKLPNLHVDFNPQTVLPKATRVAKILNEDEDFEKVLAISNARIPLVKFKCAKTALEGDITWTQSLGVYNSELLKAYTELHPIVEPFIKLVKYWAKCRDINNPGHTKTPNSYSYSLMVINFLQIQNILPSLQELYNQKYGLEREVVYVLEPTKRNNRIRKKNNFCRSLLSLEEESNFMDHHLNAFRHFEYKNLKNQNNKDQKTVASLYRRVDISYFKDFNSFRTLNATFKKTNPDFVFNRNSLNLELLNLTFKFFLFFGFKFTYNTKNIISVRKGKILNMSFGFLHTGLEQEINKLVIEDPFLLDRNVSHNVDVNFLIPEFRRAADLISKGFLEEVFDEVKR
ncbi:hypothetical protein HK099_006540 [Clydaea vesicula]|uniref:Poly(A) RNA polymerase mitochondrial-like central palm domain-containing protein n=1 Tax=Clydaea vesicula TaxID=447962 RepID=A0AAD5U619_9FUNG|nr:hypothetical protein HK099_006540 [Clydaea vesicula]